MVAPQGRSVVLVVNRGGVNGVRVGDWFVHERGSCRAQEVYPYRAKCTMRDVTAEDIGNRTGMTIWPAEMVSDALAAKWTTPEPPEPQAPPEPAPGVREPAPRLVVYRRFDETRFTHHCLGFTPDGTAAYLLRGGSYRGATHEPLVLTRFAVDGTTSERLIGDADATDEAMRVLDELRAREGLLACHEGEQKHLPKPEPEGRESRGWPALALHAPGSAIFFWVDETHLNVALAEPVLVPRQLATLRQNSDKAPGGKTHPEDLYEVLYLPGGPLHVLHLGSRGKDRWIGQRVEQVNR